MGMTEMMYVIKCITSILQEQECVAQISVEHVYHNCSLPHFASSLWVVAKKDAAVYNGHTKCAYTRTTYFYDYGVACMSVLYLYAYFDQPKITA